MPGAVPRAGAAERVEALLSWEFSGGACSSGTSAASRMHILPWSPFSRGPEEAEHGEASSRGPRWPRQSGTRLCIFLLRPPSFTPPCRRRRPGAGAGPVSLASSGITFFLYSDALALTPQFLELAPSCMGAFRTHCFPCLSSCGQLLFAPPADLVPLLPGSPP